jgi:hypothetical protein
MTFEKHKEAIDKCEGCEDLFCETRILKHFGAATLDEFHAFCERIEQSVKEGHKIYG